MASTDVRRSIKERPPIVGQSGSMFDTTRSVVLKRPGDHVPAAKLSVQQSTDFTGTKVTVRRTPTHFLKKGTRDTISFCVFGYLCVFIWFWFQWEW